MLHRLARRIGNTDERNHDIIDYIDAPILRPVQARIPVGSSFAFCHNYEPAHILDNVEEVPLGEVIVGGKHGQIHQRGIWLMEFSWHGGQTFLSPSYRIPPPKDASQPQTVHLTGVATSTICSAARVYGHALLDELPLLLYLIDTGNFRAFDAILCGPLALRLLCRCSHPDLSEMRERIIEADPDFSYYCSNFVGLKRTGCCKNPSIQELSLLRRIGGTEEAGNAPEEARRIFLRRASVKRAIKNNDEVECLMAKHNIAVVSASELKDSWKAFANADLVVGVAGSDLSDSCFMKPGACLFEIHPTDHVQPYNWNAARKLGLIYEGMLAKSEVERGTPLKPGDSPIWIDVDLLNSRLSALGGASSQKGLVMESSAANPTSTAIVD